MDFKVSLAQFIGKNIRERRQFFDINQEDLAEQIGLTRTSISNIEAGRQLPPLDILYKICHSLGSELPDLLPSYSQVSSLASENESTFDKLKTNNVPASSIKRIKSIILKYKKY